MYNLGKYDEITKVTKSLKTAAIYIDAVAYNVPISWLALNFSTTTGEIEKRLKELSSVSLQEVTTLTYLNNYDLDQYMQKFAFTSEDRKFLTTLLTYNECTFVTDHNHSILNRLYVLMKLHGMVYVGSQHHCGDSRTPFVSEYISSSFGLYPTLCMQDRSIFNNMHACAGTDAVYAVDAWFYRMSRAGIASKHSTTIRNVVTTANKVGKKVFSNKIPPVHVMPSFVHEEKIFDLMVCNDIGEHPSLVYDFLLSDANIEDYACKVNRECEELAKEITDVLNEVYRLMRNNNMHLVTLKKYRNLESYRELGKPFYSVYMSQRCGDLLI